MQATLVNAPGDLSSASLSSSFSCLSIPFLRRCSIRHDRYWEGVISELKVGGTYPSMSEKSLSEMRKSRITPRNLSQLCQRFVYLSKVRREDPPLGNLRYLILPNAFSRDGNTSRSFLYISFIKSSFSDKSTYFIHVDGALNYSTPSH